MQQKAVTQLDQLLQHGYAGLPSIDQLHQQYQPGFSPFNQLHKTGQPDHLLNQPGESSKSK